VHGHLTVNNEKMSKSRGTGISPLRYLNLGMNPEWLRYYIAFKLNSKVEDLDFTGEDFVARVNSDLIGKYVNIAALRRLHRQEIRRQAGYQPVRQCPGMDQARTGDGRRRGAPGQHRRQLRVARVRQGAARDHGDRRLRQPVRGREQAVDPGQGRSKLAELHDVCTTALILFRQLSILLSPVLPGVAANVAKFLNDENSTGPRPMWPAAWSPAPCWAAPSAPTRT
jgi:methionyl-tRNA synthetase